MSVYIRPLQESDALISYQWRNDPEVWNFTGNKPDRTITPEIESEWIRNVLQRKNELRFAICLNTNDQYIGNVQLTHITGYDAELHIFIGEKEYWSGGYGTAATRQLVDYAFNNLNLQCVYLLVRKDHIAAIKAYKKAGFYELIEEKDSFLRMATYAVDKHECKVSIFMMAYNHENYIYNALDGILMQQADFHFELVVGEDCSTDGTRQVLIDYAKKFPNKLKLILYSKNVGAHKNQIAVLNACRGTYIAMCEGDDYWTDASKLQKQADFLDANPDFSICFHKIKINKQEELIEDYITKVPGEITTQEDLFTNNNYIHTVSVLFRRKDLELPEWFVTAMPGDFPMYLFLTKNKKKIKYFNEVMAVYRVHGDGAWSMQNPKKYKQQVAITMLRCAKLIGTKNSKFITSNAISLADSIMEEGYQKLDRKEYLATMFWAAKRVSFGPRQLLYLFTPSLRKHKKST